MGDDWLEIGDGDIDVEKIMQQIRERIAGRERLAQESDPKHIADDLWRQMIGSPTDDTLYGRLASIRPRDCDMVPRQYSIDWRVPILGPIHARIRKIINDEIRRFLMPSLEKQSSLNRRLLQILKELAQENARLRDQVETFSGHQAEQVD